jgi:hypothetical protein
MSLYVITATFHLPDDYALPDTGGTEVKIRNITDRATPISHSVWGTPRLPTESPKRFTFNIDSDSTAVGDEFAINVNMTHEGTELLLDIEHTFRWGGDNEEVDIHLSPVGYISVHKTFMPRIAYPEDSKMTVKLIEKPADGGPEIVVTEGSILTAATQPFYLRYNPQTIKPAQRYRLTAVFEIHGGKYLTLGVHPRELVLMPEKKQMSFGG